MRPPKDRPPIASRADGTERRWRLDDGLANRLDAHRRRVGATTPRRLARELDPLDRDAVLGEHAIDRDEAGVVLSRTGAGREHESLDVHAAHDAR